MRSAVKRRSKAARTPARSSAAAAATLATAPSASSTMNPLTPSSITSGTEPRRKAITGVPQAIASIITSPKGSGQSIGKSSAMAPPRNSALSFSPISPMNSMPGRDSIGRMRSSNQS